MEFREKETCLGWLVEFGAGLGVGRERERERRIMDVESKFDFY